MLIISETEIKNKLRYAIETITPYAHEENSLMEAIENIDDVVDALSRRDNTLHPLGDDPRYRKGHFDGVQAVRDYMIKQVGHCHFGE